MDKAEEWDRYADVVQEDPEFPVLLAKARAKARGEKYDPKRHGPFDANPPPAQHQEAEVVDAEMALRELLARFEARGQTPRSRHMRAVPSSADRPSVRRVREL